MRRLFDEIPLAAMNTSMTINATAMWLLALYEVVAEEQGATADQLAGTTQNDIIKEYLSRGTYVFPPEHSLRLTTDMIAYTVATVPQWNPINICSYHLQEAGATPVQELAYALSTAIAVLDSVRSSGQVEPADFERVVGRISFFVNAGVRFIEETCKMRAFGQLWDTITRERYGVEDPKMRRLRYGVQVNSLGLTEAQPENNVQRIVLEMLGVTLSKSARARAVQLPAWNEALGLPRPWDQQWSLRLQQVLAFESDLLEHEDIFDGSRVIEAKVAELGRGRHRGDRPRAGDGRGRGRRGVGLHEEPAGLVALIRRARIEAGEDVVVGVNAYVETEPSPADRRPRRRDPSGGPQAEAAAIRSVQEWRAARDDAACQAAIERLREDAKTGANLMPATLVAARAGLTTGEWAGTLREVFGEYRAPTGVSDRSGWLSPVLTSRRCASASGSPARSSAAGCGCWSASRASTGTATVRSRSRSGPATPASRSSTRASVSRRPRSSPRPWPRTCTASACRSCPGRTWSWCRRCWTGCTRRACPTCR
jgi:(2R)-ethylmalonyl-CoA mutase